MPVPSNVTSLLEHSSPTVRDECDIWAADSFGGIIGLTSPPFDENYMEDPLIHLSKPVVSRIRAWATRFWGADPKDRAKISKASANKEGKREWGDWVRAVWRKKGVNRKVLEALKLRAVDPWSFLEYEPAAKVSKCSLMEYITTDAL